MAQIKISDLPLYTGSTTGVYLVMNNSGETTTYKVSRENIIGASGTSGTSGSSGSSGTSGSSGSNGSSGTSGTSGSNGSSGSSGDSLFALTGSVWNTTNNVGITGSLDLKGNFNSYAVDFNLNGATNTSAKTLSFMTTGVTAGTTIQYLPDTGSGGPANMKYYSNYSNILIGGTQANVELFNINNLGAKTISLKVTGSVVNITGSLTVTGSINNNRSSINGVVIGNGNIRGTDNISLGGNQLWGGPGNNNIAIGNGSLERIISGSGNIGFGSFAGRLNTNGNYNLNIGSGAGWNNTNSNQIYIDMINGPRANNNDEISGSIIYGNQTTGSALFQKLRLNAQVQIFNGLTVETGSVNISTVMTLAQQSPLPTGSVGTLAVSGSNLFYHNGSSWSQIN
jgi:hypothetical protein